jgi:hypothetical protein
MPQRIADSGNDKQQQHGVIEQYLDHANSKVWLMSKGRRYTACPFGLLDLMYPRFHAPFGNEAEKFHFG